MYVDDSLVALVAVQSGHGLVADRDASAVRSDQGRHQQQRGLGQDGGAQDDDEGEEKGTQLEELEDVVKAFGPQCLVFVRRRRHDEHVPSFGRLTIVVVHDILLVVFICRA